MEESIAHRQPPLLKISSTAFVILWLIIAAFPFLWTVWGSFKVEGDFFSRETWLNAVFGVKTMLQTGSPFTWAGYYGAWVTDGLWRAAFNGSANMKSAHSAR